MWPDKSCLNYTAQFRLVQLLVHKIFIMICASFAYSAPILNKRCRNCVIKHLISQLNTYSVPVPRCSLQPQLAFQCWIFNLSPFVTWRSFCVANVGMAHEDDLTKYELILYRMYYIIEMLRGVTALNSYPGELLSDWSWLTVSKIHEMFDMLRTFLIFQEQLWGENFDII